MSRQGLRRRLSRLEGPREAPSRMPLTVREWLGDPDDVPAGHFVRAEPIANILSRNGRAPGVPLTIIYSMQDADRDQGAPMVESDGRTAVMALPDNGRGD